MNLRALFSMKSRAAQNPPKAGGSRARRRSWLRDQRGAVTPLFLVSSVAVLGTSLGAIDLVRYNVVQGKMQNALDGATLSAGRNLANLTPKPGTPVEKQWQSDAFEYFRSNLPEGYLGSQIAPEDLVINYSEELDASGVYITGQQISMDVKGVLPLVSTGFLKVSSFEVKASNSALRRTRSDLEVVMALDNTGSMSSGGKIGILKNAAKELASIVLGATSVPGAPQKVYIGLVPFADTVNVGNTGVTRGWLSFPEAQRYYIENLWSGCIVEPPPSTWGGGNLPAAAFTPTAGFQPLHLTLATTVGRSDLGLSNTSNNYERIALLTADNKPQPREFNRNEAGNGPVNDRRVWARRSDNTEFTVYSAFNPSNCKNSRLTRFLSNDLPTINSAIDAMQADGNTLIPTGLLWAWRMLHKDWRGTPGWGDPDMPRDPEPNKLTKVIVLLTDGMNEPSSSRTSAAEDPARFAYGLKYDAQKCNNKNNNNYTNCNSTLIPKTFTQGRFSVERRSQFPMTSLRMRDPFETNGNDSGSATIGWGRSGDMNTASVDSYLTAVCNNVKSDVNGIKIYTVTLGNVGGSTETRMNNCSSGAGYFYNANNVNDLPQVFRSIAGALTELRLTQ